MRHIASLSGWILALGASLLGAACGGSVDEVSSGAASGAGGDASSSSEAATTASGAGGDGQGGLGTSGSATSGSATTGAGGAASEGVTPKLESTGLILNCQPFVPPDPIQGSFTAKYTNSGASPASATITSAKLTFGSAPNALSWPLTLSPSSAGPVQPGATLSVKHEKQKAAGGAPEGSPCSFCDSTMTLTVTWDLGGGKTAVDMLPAEKVGCVF